VPFVGGVDAQPVSVAADDLHGRSMAEGVDQPDFEEVPFGTLTARAYQTLGSPHRHLLGPPSSQPGGREPVLRAHAGGGSARHHLVLDLARTEEDRSNKVLSRDSRAGTLNSGADGRDPVLLRRRREGITEDDPFEDPGHPDPDLARGVVAYPGTFVVTHFATRWTSRSFSAQTESRWGRIIAVIVVMADV
jgi:hypothetical protein